MTAQHTPGPWTIEAHEHEYCIMADGKHIASVWAGDDESGDFPVDENARAIVSVTDLLTAVQLALPVLRKYREGDLNGGCANDADGNPDRATLEADFLPLVTACEAAIAAGEQAVARAMGRV